VLCDQDANESFPVYRRPRNHIGPIDGFNFMSLNMTDEQLDVIQRAMLKAIGETPEECLKTICNQYLRTMEVQEPVT
jgi:hypothetical protein